MSNSTLAPSEKHLEDWIVEYQSDYFVKMVQFSHGGFYHEFIISKLIGRQVNLPSGRFDLLATEELGLVVIELKKGYADSECVTQLMRYVADLKEIYDWTLYRISHRDDYLKFNYPELPSDPPRVRGIIISQGLADPKLKFACDGANIEVINYIYHPKDDWYSFVSHHDSTRRETLKEIYMDFSQGFIGDAFIDVETRWAAFRNPKEETE